jgi:hypothetical protein
LHLHLSLCTCASSVDFWLNKTRLDFKLLSKFTSLQSLATVGVIDVEGVGL